MADFVRNDEHLNKFISILRLLKEAGYLADDQIASALTIVNRNYEWLERNLSGIEAWLNDKISTPPTAKIESATESLPLK